MSSPWLLALLFSSLCLVVPSPLDAATAEKTPAGDDRPAKETNAGKPQPPAAQPTAAKGKLPTYDVLYTIELVPVDGLARVRIRVDRNDHLVETMSLRIDPERHREFKGDGRIETVDDRLVWHVPQGSSELRYEVVIDHPREDGDGQLDARMTDSWALFRGEDIFPPTATESVPVETNALLEVKTPNEWSVVTRFPRRKDGRFEIEQTHRDLDRPTGWMLAGKLGVNRETREGVKLVLASPANQDPRRLDLLAMLRWTLPKMIEIFPDHPDRLLIVRAEDPMWRGGLSGPSSVYLHADRPLIESDGTSPLLHELTHSLMHARAGNDGDWIVEGLAEYYSLEVLRRSRTISKRRYERSLEKLEKRGKKASNLLVERASGAVTARAVGMLVKLDERIRRKTSGKRSLDDVARALQAERKPVTTKRFRELAEKISADDLSDFFRDQVGGKSG